MSEGMLCSETELEIGTDDSGLKIFPDDAPLGCHHCRVPGCQREISFLISIINPLLTVPDLWGHYGMAREFAAVFRNELKNPFSK